MSYVVLALFLLGLALVFAVIFIRANVQQLARTIRYTGATLAFLTGVLLAARGWMLAALPMFFVGLAFLGRAGRLSGYFPWSLGQKSPRQSSRVRTSLIEMTLDHDTGAMTGRVS